ncbi:ferritin-like domain-containing protein [Spirosoma sp. KCTC 42546]|uniref:ferritin-like domain-containing protein n=1 Tax=Spirosoma sp. KCTC 42546 TaxID=2520506 RepID=UPI0011573679|nr:ferritin-like domain-containing protein [Spirosoma sp. KCTC 42546]QDK78644.1 ferritin-like domain-containing protein [Spirosoma sp. KCTC 42546]
MNLQSIFAELEQVDNEFFDRLEHVSRRGLFSSLTKKTVAVAAPSILASALTSAYGQSSALPDNVVDVLNFALTLEYLEYRFYDIGNNLTMIPSQYKPAFELIRRHEQIHVNLLKTVLGSKAIAEPKFDFSAKGNFPDTFTNFQTFAAVSQAFEDTGVRAYKGQAPNLMNAKPILETALQIHATEATHAARVRFLRGQKGWISQSSPSGLPPAAAGVYMGEGNVTQKNINLQGILNGVVPIEGITEAFDEPLTKEQVLEIVKPFLA